MVQKGNGGMQNCPFPILCAIYNRILLVATAIIPTFGRTELPIATAIWHSVSDWWYITPNDAWNEHSWEWETWCPIHHQYRRERPNSRPAPTIPHAISHRCCTVPIQWHAYGHERIWRCDCKSWFSFSPRLHRTWQSS